MPCRQRHELLHAPTEEGAVTDQDRTNALLRKTCEGRFEIAIGSGIPNNELQAQRARCRLQVCNDRLGSRKRRERGFQDGEAGDVPFGRSSRATIPLATGSATLAKTMGIVRVSRWTAAAAGVPYGTITSGCKPTNSRASPRIRSM